jgi:hypothetical protein
MFGSKSSSEKLNEKVACRFVRLCNAVLYRVGPLSIPNEVVKNRRRKWLARA